MSAVIGIDPSLTATGIAWPDGTTEVIAWPGRGVERLAGAYAQIETWSTMSGPLDWPDPLVVIEGYSFGSPRARSAHAHSAAELGGVIRLALHHQNVTVLEVAPAVVKKYATGKGNANKDLVRDAARDRLGLPAGVTSDECDAAWLRQIGLRITGGAFVQVPKVHATALDKLDLSAWEAAA